MGLESRCQKLNHFSCKWVDLFVCLFCGTSLFRGWSAWLRLICPLTIVRRQLTPSLTLAITSLGANWGYRASNGTGIVYI